MHDDEGDRLDGCELDFTLDPTSDAEAARLLGPDGGAEQAWTEDEHAVRQRPR